jgi:hypothetical protein
MRLSDLNSEELAWELHRFGFLDRTLVEGGSHHRLAVSLEQLEPLAAALTCEGRMVCPQCRQDVIGCCSELCLFECRECGLWLLWPIDGWEPRRKR